MCSKVNCSSKSCSDHVGVSAFSWSHRAGSTNLNQIRAYWVFTGVRPISPHIQNTRGLCSNFGTVKQETSDYSANRIVVKERWGGPMDIRPNGSPGRLLPFHLLPVHRQKLVQLCKELRRWWAIVLFSQDKSDPLSWRNCRKHSCQSLHKILISSERIDI